MNLFHLLFKGQCFFFKLLQTLPGTGHPSQCRRKKRQGYRLGQGIYTMIHDPVKDLLIDISADQKKDDGVLRSGNVKGKTDPCVVRQGRIDDDEIITALIPGSPGGTYVGNNPYRLIQRFDQKRRKSGIHFFCSRNDKNAVDTLFQTHIGSLPGRCLSASFSAVDTYDLRRQMVLDKVAGQSDSTCLLIALGQLPER